MSLYRVGEEIAQRHLNTNLPRLRLGDRVTVTISIYEENKKRVQTYYGTLISYHRAGINSTITLRRIFQSVGIERVFPLHSTAIQDLKILRHSKVRRAKLYYLRNLKGRAIRLREVLNK
jgi:large subunit ribosomal protein L19